MIAVSDYDPAWPRRFEQLRQEYAHSLARARVPVVTIEHVGSTAVPGLAAKPVIDCDVVVNAAAVPQASQVLIDLGFLPQGELGIPERWAFREPARLAATNTYVVIEGSLALRNHLLVRDTLRARADLRDRYGALKKRLGPISRTIEEYGQAKNALIQEILSTAGMTAAERATIDSYQLPTRDEVPR